MAARTPGALPIPRRLSAQLAEQSSRADEMIVEDPAGDVEQITDQRVAQRVSHRQSFLLRRHDVLVPQHGQLLRDDRLLQRQRVLELLHGAAAAHEDFQDPDPGGMSQVLERTAP